MQTPDCLEVAGVVNETDADPATSKGGLRKDELDPRLQTTCNLFTENIGLESLFQWWCRGRHSRHCQHDGP